MPLYNVRTLAEHVDRSLYADRLRANLIGALALLALSLAAIGIYAVLSYTVAERTREVGVRLALGAPPRAVLRMLIGSGARVAAIGIAAGLVLAAILTRSWKRSCTDCRRSIRSRWGRRRCCSSRWHSRPRSCPPGGRHESIRSSRCVGCKTGNR